MSGGIIPVVPGEAEQILETTLDDHPVVLRVRWNTRAALWFLDLWEADGVTPIALGLCVVLGALLGRRYQHPVFAGGLFAVDESGTGVEAGLQDLGGRVKLYYLTARDMVLARALPPESTP